MKLLTAILSLSLLVAGAPIELEAADTIRGQLAFLETCPGDVVRVTANVTDEAALLAALLTPLLTGVVSQGIKTAGKNLTEAAQEASVDVVHRGDHFYRFRLAEENFDLTFRCVVVASKGTTESGKDLADLASGYQAAELEIGDDGRIERSNWQPKAAQLTEYLEGAGFSKNHLPGIVGVFDLELSAQRTAARLIPRFIAMDHSVRERKVDTRARTITFEFSFDSPDAEKPFANTLVKVDKLAIGSPFVLHASGGDSPIFTSEWFALPQLNTSTGQRKTAHIETRKARDTELEAATLAAAAATVLDDPDVKPFAGANPPCPIEANARRLWVQKHAELAAENAKPSDQKNPGAIARLTSAELFFKSCLNYAKQQVRLNDDGLRDGEFARAFDLTVILKEFRKRPFAEFFGAALSDEATRKGITAAVIAGIDPGTRAAAEEARAGEILALREAYETAIVAAETAIVVYETAKQEDKALKFVDMEAKKRSANRKATALSIPQPYPESGTWF